MLLNGLGMILYKVNSAEPVFCLHHSLNSPVQFGGKTLLHFHSLVTRCVRTSEINRWLATQGGADNCARLLNILKPFG